jgi:hypothetical protein
LLPVVSTSGRPSKGSQATRSTPNPTSLVFTVPASAEIVEALAEGFISELRALIAHCQSISERGNMASVFPVFDWEQDCP